MSFTPPNMIAPFWGWTEFTPALPDFYWDVYSAEERIKKICMELHKLCDYANMLGENINIDHEIIKELEDAFTKFMESGFNDYYKQQVEAWIDANFQTIMNSLMGKMLFFGLTDDGYFVAYIPKKWELAFDTDIVSNSENYGRLQIFY